MKRFNFHFLGLLFVFVASLTLAACGGSQSHDHDGHSHDHTEATHDHEGHDHATHEGHDHEGHDHGEAAKASTAEKGPEYTSAYICPMHCKGSGSDKPGVCPACKMDYVANADKE